MQFLRVVRLMKQIVDKKLSIYRAIAKKDAELNELEHMLTLEKDNLNACLQVEGWEVKSVNEFYERKAKDEKKAFNLAHQCHGVCCQEPQNNIQSES